MGRQSGSMTPQEPQGEGDRLVALPLPWRALYFDAAAFMSRGLLLGFFCGALIGGAGGRLAMFVLRLTSDDSVRGLETDDEFTIGEFTLDTVFLVVFAAALGAVGGLLYMAGREWLPRRARPAISGLLFGTLGGALVIEPGGIDFTLVEPHWLAVAMFIALPALYGAALSVAIERSTDRAASREPRTGMGRWLGALPLGLILVGGPFGAAALLAAAIVVAINRSGVVLRAWRSMPAIWLGRGVLMVAMGGGAFELVRDAIDII